MAQEHMGQLFIFNHGEGSVQGMKGARVKR